MPKKNKTHIEERLQDLHALKEVYNLQTKAKDWKKKANMKEVVAPDENDFRTQTSVVVKMQKDADLLSAIPEYHFKPLNKKGRGNRKIVRYSWDYHWLISNTDKAISDVVQSSTTFGTWILYEGIKHEFKKEKVPTMNKEWLVDFKEKEYLKYSGVESKKIPFENFFINGNDIENSTEACVISYFDKEDYCNVKELDPNYTNISEVRKSEMATPWVDGTSWEQFSETTLDNTVMQIEYYNIAKDEYIVEANGIEVRNTPSPHPHKELPFALYIWDKAEDRIWGMGIFELLEQEERYKNELRTLLVRWVKFSIGIILKDKSADIEEDELMTGLGEVYEADDIDGIRQYNFNVPIRDISDTEVRVDNDIIAKSGIDFKSLYLAPSETATRTQNKTLSSKKRINKNIKDNAYSFFKRLAYLRMSNIQFLHSIKDMEIPIEGWSIDSEWVFQKDETGWTWSAIITKQLIAGDFLVLPITETMLWDSKIRRREDAKEYASLVSPIVNDDGSRVVKGWPLAKLLTEEFGYDFEDLTEATSMSRDPKQMLEDFKMQTKWTKWTQADPNFVGVDQRSWKASNVPTLSGRSSAQRNTLPLWEE